LDCSWYDSDVLVDGGFFVEIDSYAIAILCYASSSSGNSMGLILDARGSPSPHKSNSLWKAETLLRIRTHTLRLLLLEDTVWIQSTQSQKLCRRSWTQVIYMMNTKIESSTEVCPCKKRATVDDLNFVGF